jgi:Raf kinase inhibitor-like YbhB/YbcL family protein
MRFKRLTTLAAAGVLAALAGCSGRGEETTNLTEAEAPAAEPARGLYDPETRPATIALTSPAFQDGQPLPTRFTCDGRDLSPPLNWTGVPEGARSLVLIVSDPDAPNGTFSHWVVFNLPPELNEIKEGGSEADAFAEIIGAASTRPVQGTNGFNNTAYNGPCPPKGSDHRYVFQLYALDRELALDRNADREQLLNAIAGHVLAEGRLTATFSREQAS